MVKGNDPSALLSCRSKYRAGSFFVKINFMKSDGSKRCFSDQINLQGLSDLFDLSRAPIHQHTASIHHRL
jgi:hypothetical protein